MRRDQETRRFQTSAVQGETIIPRQLLLKISRALEEKGYKPVDQIVGYLVSGDPAYITSHGDARSLIKQLDRDVILEDIVRSYLEPDSLR